MTVTVVAVAGIEDGQLGVDCEDEKVEDKAAFARDDPFSNPTELAEETLAAIADEKDCDTLFRLDDALLDTLARLDDTLLDTLASSDADALATNLFMQELQRRHPPGGGPSCWRRSRLSIAGVGTGVINAWLKDK